MASEEDDRERTRQLRREVVIGAAMGLIAAGVAGQQLDAPRVLVLCALLAIAGAALLRHGLMRLGWRTPREADDPQPSSAQALDAQRRFALAREARLEHAPVALWLADSQGLQPLNVAARRLLAPGRARTPAALEPVLREAGIGRRQLVSFDSEQGQERAILACSSLTVAGQAQRLIALMPIESELEAETLDAWRQLVHVLTHEIMNSLTPIASLSRTAKDMAAELPDQPDLVTALDAVARRAAHLVEFISSYRSVSRLPLPRLRPVRIDDVFARLSQLVDADWRARGGSVHFEVEPASVELMADPDQLEQALLNLIRNAADATSVVASPRLEVSARLVRGGRLAIEVSDNGPGVPSGLEANIFTPFFTTKANGLGIGLTLVRNLVHGMGGSVRHARRASGGACFVLTF